MLPPARPFLALALVGLGISAAPLDPCGTKAPSWTLRNLNITTRDEVGEDGTAGFILTYNLTNQTESVSCPLHSNYRCTITGTQSDNSTVIDLQLGLGSVYVSVVEVLSCGDSGSYVIPPPQFSLPLFFLVGHKLERKKGRRERELIVWELIAVPPSREALKSIWTAKLSGSEHRPAQRSRQHFKG
ncbi:hypothetical protein F5Y07DRAFT_368297 [Xylaria sp. FL0933]|nr:hypothetical protein F5Y07DRAFT_368297 [Xylaria sp. FL0933]